LRFRILDAQLQIVDLLRVPFDLPSQFGNTPLSGTTARAGKRRLRRPLILSAPSIQRVRINFMNPSHVDHGIARFQAH
jgi:hypothetical protein